MEISTDERFASSLQYIKRKTGGKISTINERHILITDTKDTQNIVDILADVIVTDCKAHYIGMNIRLPIEDAVTRHAFIRALSTFDRDTDKIIAKTIIKATPHFLLDSFYEFMLDVLKSRWNEVCLLANENICYLVCQKTFFELLRFLISNIESLSDEVHIFTRGEEFEVLGSGLKPLQDIYINESLPMDVQIVSKLVTIAPKKIFVHNDAGGFSVGLVENIQNLFGSCVVVN